MGCPGAESGNSTGPPALSCRLGAREAKKMFLFHRREEYEVSNTFKIELRTDSKRGKISRGE